MAKTNILTRTHNDRKKDYNWIGTTKSSRARAFYIKTHVINSLLNLNEEEKKPSAPLKQEEQGNSLKFISYSLRKFRQSSKPKDAQAEKPTPLYYLPPVQLPPIYRSINQPQQRASSLKRSVFPTPRRGPISEREWRELRLCRYIRPGLPKYQSTLDIVNDENIRLEKIPILKKINSNRSIRAR